MLKDLKLEIVYKPINSIIGYVNNTRVHPQSQIDQIKSSIVEFGMCTPIGIHNNIIVYGHGRYEALKQLGYDEIPTLDLSHLSEAQRKGYIIADNKIGDNSTFDEELLKIEIEALQDMDFNIDLLGFSEDELRDILNDIPNIDEMYSDGIKGSMAENFGVAPFSVLDTRKKEWQDRKKWWQSMIKDNGESREGTLGAEGGLLDNINSVSILDATMAELIASWFGGKNKTILDPFAGDSVFGFVSSYLGMNFIGIELREEQAVLNQQRCDEYQLSAKYINDTSENMDNYIEKESVDMIFSCPPYADLEVYSDNPKDLSTMSHSDFFKIYKKILQNTYSRLKPNRFAVIVMGEVRNKDGVYIGTIPNTIKIMEEVGYKFYNEIILVNSAGTLPLRAGKAMKSTRKVGKMHQNILVFLKGNAKEAVQDLGDIEINFNYTEED